MQFRIADTFTESLARLNAEEQRAAKTTAFDLQLNPAQPGLQFHRVDRARDKNFWSVRVNKAMRMIVHKTAANLLLCYVGEHDDAYRWAERRLLEQHPHTGAAQLVEIREVVREIEIPRYVASERAVFAGVLDSQLLHYGVPAEWLDDVKQVTDEDRLLALAVHLPAEAAEALLELATGSTPERPVRGDTDGDPFAHPDAQRRFRVMSNQEELRRALEYPWEYCPPRTVPNGDLRMTAFYLRNKETYLSVDWLKSETEVGIEGAVNEVIERCLAHDFASMEDRLLPVRHDATRLPRPLGHELANKTLEGYPGARYHAGGRFVDVIEQAAVDRACELFECAYANVQPHSGSQANLAVFFALLRPGDRVLSLDLAAGGHLSHGLRANLSGRWFEAHHYGVSRETGMIDYDEAAARVLEVRPRLLIAGGSSYPRILDFERLADAARTVGAYFVVDMAHIAGLVAGGVHPSPIPHADIVTCTTTKTLRGPRGGMILARDESWKRKLLRS